MQWIITMVVHLSKPTSMFRGNSSFARHSIMFKLRANQTQFTVNYAVENCSRPHLCNWKTATSMKALQSNQAWFIFTTVTYSTRLQPAENHTFGGRKCIIMGLLNPILSVLTLTMWRKTCLVSFHCSYLEQYSISMEHNWWLCKMPLWQTVKRWWGPLGRHMQNSFNQHRTTNHSNTGHITNAVQILRYWWLRNFTTYVTIYTLCQI